MLQTIATGGTETNIYTTIGESFSTGMEDIVQGITGMVALVLPAGLAIVGISLAIGWGKKILKTLGKG